MSADLKVFIDLLKQDLQTLSQLEDVLQQERDSLEQSDIETLQRIIESKLPLLQQIESHARARMQWVSQTGLSIDRFLSLLKEKAPPVMKLYRQCESCLANIHKLNEVNGRIIARSQQRTTKMMQIIRGQSQHMQLYGKNGAEKSVGEGQAIAQA
ncbi:putative flagella synthesis protein FlgN [Hahella chejuensis KCTC 2396]|uniref:Putative flagella synthesis protein FlgN n=1 Tax=Hahella chejuensis (strain KCTC 2396) TaxID=349521 RepID=Q2SD54_HAHCH|nr:flagellar protein FlgN [Hahella chejuensis]ABC31420.1 putative flagella synthesis protein FlgN [Hahella chejuensis KCTC 2396]